MLWLYTGLIFKLQLLMKDARKLWTEVEIHGKSSGYVQSLFHEHLLNARAMVFWHVALNLVFSLQALWESSGREVLGLGCSKRTVGLDNTSQLAGAPQPSSVLLVLHFCTPLNSAWFLLMEGRHEVGFDFGHLLTANISVSELGKCRIWPWLAVKRPDFGTQPFLGPLRFLLFTQSRHSSFCPDCYSASHRGFLLWAFSWAILLERTDNLIYVSLPFQMSTVGCSPLGSSCTMSSPAIPSQT